MHTEEMYRRGYTDAERGEPNPFYHEHYYHYRRGYNDGRRALNQPGWARRFLVLGGVFGALLALGVGFALWNWFGPGQANSTARQRPTLIIPTLVRETAVPFTPTPEPTATPPIVGLRIGGKATVGIDADTGLRGRREPSLNAPAVVTFRRDDVVEILEGPVEADNYTWWRIQNQRGVGWSAQSANDGTVWLIPIE
jgi:hypothetical protein